MPKKAAATEEKTVSKAAFLKALQKKEQAAKASAKKKRPEGFMDDAAMLEALGIPEGGRATFEAAVSKISFSFAKGDANRPMFRFGYVLVSDDPKINGKKLSENFILEEGKKSDGEVFRTEEEATDQLIYAFQALGEDTEGWVKKGVLASAVEAAEQHTKDKTPISITISDFLRKKGTKDESRGMNIRVNGPLADDDNSDLEDEEAPEDEDVESEDQGEEEGEFNADEWIGNWVVFKNEEYGDENGLVRMKVDSYDEETDTFSGTDANGESWSGDYAVKVADAEWDDNQDD